jgi:hypothetical protein
VFDGQLKRIVFLVGELVGAPAGGEVADRLLGQAGLTGDR